MGILTVLCDNYVYGYSIHLVHQCVAQITVNNSQYLNKRLLKAMCVGCCQETQFTCSCACASYAPARRLLSDVNKWLPPTLVVFIFMKLLRSFETLLTAKTHLL